MKDKPSMQSSSAGGLEAILLVGGFGTRLRPLTADLPKPMLPLMDDPMVLWNLRRLKGVARRAILATGFRAGVFRKLAERKTEIPPLRFCREKEPLGTGGAIGLAVQQAREKELLVLNADVLSDVDLPQLIARHRRRRAQITIVLKKMKGVERYGLVDVDESFRVRRFREKPSDPAPEGWINAGVYLMSKELAASIPPLPLSIERDVFPQWIREGVAFHAFPHEGFWLDIGTPRSYWAAHQAVLEKKLSAPYLKRWRGGFGVKPTGTKIKITTPVYTGPGCELAPRCEVGPFAVLGAGVKVEEGASVRHSLLMAGARVGKEAGVKDCLIGRGVRVAAGAELTGAVVGAGSFLRGGLRPL